MVYTRGGWNSFYVHATRHNLLSSAATVAMRLDVFLLKKTENIVLFSSSEMWSGDLYAYIMQGRGTPECMKGTVGYGVWYGLISL